MCIRDRHDVALLDPPYTFLDWDDLLESLPAEAVVIESEREILLPEPWTSIKAKKYGSTFVVIAKRTRKIP